MKGRIKEDDESCRRRTATGSTGRVRGRRRISQMVSPPCRRRPRRADPRRTGAGRRQGLFPARRACGQPGRRAARLCGRYRRLGALHVLKVATSRPAIDLPDEIGTGATAGLGRGLRKGLLYTDANEQLAYRQRACWHHRLGDPQSATASSITKTTKFACQPRPHPVNGALHLHHRRSRDQRSPAAAAVGSVHADPVLVTPRVTSVSYDVDEREARSTSTPTTPTRTSASRPRRSRAPGEWTS